MKFTDFKPRILLEGGNAIINNQSADRIDSNAREQVVPLIDNSLRAINAAFAQYSGKPLWHAELLASRAFLSGSAFHFFDRENIKDLKFVAAKPTVGDIDTQVDAEMRDEIIAWLQKLPPGSRLGDAVYIGVKDDPAALAGGQFITLWSFPGIQIKTKQADGTTNVRGTNVQIDLELKEFETRPGTKYRQPTRWSAFSASSAWGDLEAGVKGVFHKYLIQALTYLTTQTVVIRKPVYNRRTKEYDTYKYSEPTQSPMYSFAVASKEGGGLRPTLSPVLDSTGRQEEVDGVPVYDLVGSTGYTRNIDDMFASIFGDRIKKSEFKKISNQFDSFIGLLGIMKKYLTQEERTLISDKFREKIIGRDDRNRRAQELYKGDPTKDRKEKLTAFNLLNKTLGTTPIPGFNDMVNDYYATYDKASRTEESITEAADPKYKRVGVKHIYMPGSTVELPDAMFIDLCREIADNNGLLDSAEIHLKVDGAGRWFGKDQSGEPFFLPKKLIKPLTINDVGTFEKYARENNVSPEQIEYFKAYDDALRHILTSDWIKRLPKDTIVQAEMLATGMGQRTDGGIKFKSIVYDPKKLGSKMTLVPFKYNVYSTGEPHPKSREIQELLLKSSDKDTKFVNSALSSQGIDVSKIIDPVVNMDPKLVAALKSRSKDTPEKQQAKDILTKARQQLSQTIYSSNKVKGRDQLGKSIEGYIIKMPSGITVKVTSPEMQKAVAATQADRKSKAATASPVSNRTRTAVVTIGSFAGHRGHQRLIDLVLNTARQLGGDPFIYVSPKVGPDDPIPPNVKLETLRRLYPDIVNHIQTWDPAGTPVKKIEKEIVLPANSPYKHVILIVGNDRYETFKRWMGVLAQRMQDPRYPGSHNSVTFDTQMINRSEEGGGDGWSFTKLRNALKNPDYSDEQKLAVWMRGFDGVKLGEEYIKQLMQITAQGMGLQPQIQKEDDLEERFNLPGHLGTRRDRFKSLRKEAATGAKFTGYFKGQDRPPVGRRLVGGESIEPGDRVRTKTLISNGIVESIEYYRPFGEMAVYYKDANNCLMRTPISNVIKIPYGE